MKLQKRDPASLLDHNVAKEVEFLMQKHAGAFMEDTTQKVLGGFGGAGRPLRTNKGDGERLWAQMIEEENENALKGGHGVPLSSE